MEKGGAAISETIGRSDCVFVSWVSNNRLHFQASNLLKFKPKLSLSNNLKKCDYTGSLKFWFYGFTLKISIGKENDFESLSDHYLHLPFHFLILCILNCYLCP